MDPISAFSLAGTILQFIDSGSAFVAYAWNLYRGEPGSTKHPRELVLLTTSFDHILRTFESFGGDDSRKSQHDSLLHLAEECKEVTARLLTLLRKLSPDKKYRKRDALKVAFQKLWDEGEIESLRNRLDGFRNQFNLHLLVSLRQYALQSSSEKETTRHALGILKESTSNLEGIANTILEHLASKASFSDTSQMAETLRTGLVTEIYHEDPALKSNMASAISLSPRRRQILRDRILFALQYDTMDEREFRIPKAYESTFESVFRDTTSEGKSGYNLKRWLESDDQVYWITG